MKRLQRIWSSDLNFNYKALATNVLAVPIFRNYFSVLKTDLTAVDKATRCMKRKNKCHQYSVAPRRLYLLQSCGGRGFHQLMHLTGREVVSMVSYLLMSVSLRTVARH